MPLAVHLALIAVQFLFSSLAITGKFVLGEVPPAALVLVRVVGATLVLVAVHRATRGAVVTDRRDLWRLLWLGLLGIAANQSLFLLGLARTTAINATMLVATAPVFTALNAMVFKEEPTSAVKITGIAVAAVGSAWLIGFDQFSFHAGTALGNLLILAGMYAYSHYLVLGKAMLRRYGAVTVTTYIMGFATLGVLPLGLPAVAHLDLAAIRPSTWLWVGYIVAGPTVATYFLNIWALQRASSNMVAAYIYLQPLFTVSLAPLVLQGEHLSGRTALGGLGIFAGLGLVIWGERAQRQGLPLAALPGE